MRYCFRGSTRDPQRSDQRSTWSPGKKKALHPACSPSVWAGPGDTVLFLPWQGAQHRHWHWGSAKGSPHGGADVLTELEIRSLYRGSALRYVSWKPAFVHRAVHSISPRGAVPTWERCWGLFQPRAAPPTPGEAGLSGSYLAPQEFKLSPTPLLRHPSHPLLGSLSFVENAKVHQHLLVRQLAR